MQCPSTLQPKKLVIIAEKLDTTVPTVRLCLKKYAESGVKTALEDASGRGRRHEIFDDSKTWVINIACQKPTAFGLSAELWYPTSLTRYINSVAVEQGYPRMATASESSIRKILRKAQLNPHKVFRYYIYMDIQRVCISDKYHGFIFKKNNIMGIK